jgi:hypothetical protein
MPAYLPPLLTSERVERSFSSVPPAKMILLIPSSVLPQKSVAFCGALLGSAGHWKQRDGVSNLRFARYGELQIRNTGAAAEEPISFTIYRLPTGRTATGCSRVNGQAPHYAATEKF